MKKLLSLLLAPAFLIMACNKKATQDQLADPKPQSTIIRTFNYPSRPATVTARYEPAAIDATASRYTDGMTLYFNASPKSQGAVGDGIAIILSRAELKDGYVGTYAINPASGSALRYVYSYLSPNGSSITNILNSEDGMEFEGELTIDTYDPDRGLISGTYDLQIKNLINDPTKDPNEPSNPNDPCNVSVRGMFVNVKIKQ